MIVWEWGAVAIPGAAAAKTGDHPSRQTGGTGDAAAAAELSAQVLLLLLGPLQDRL